MSDMRMSGEYVICPACGDQQGDCWEWVKEDARTDDCPNCGARITYFAEYSVVYITTLAEPRND